MTNKFSIIIPVRRINDYIIDEIIPALKDQTYQNFELIIVPDKYKQNLELPDWVKIIPSWPKIGPADKRDLGVKESKGEILAFLDDDAYPDKKWLESALKIFENNSQAAAVCGPGVTPPSDSLLAKVSGWVWSSRLGAEGAGYYRCWPAQRREVDDYPTFNLLVRKKDFTRASGFNSDFWPGEDTKLCQDLVYKLNKKIIYDPKIKVFHHRRKIFGPHLKQIARYGRQRGRFAKILPKTSRRMGYFIPSIFTLTLVFGLIFYFIYKPLFWLYLVILMLYFSLLLGTAFWVWKRSRSFIIASLTIPAIYATHTVYGLMFIIGYLNSLRD